MSHSSLDVDYVARTKKIAEAIYPTESGANWLDHGAGNRGKECAVIDLLLMTGLFDKKQIANAIRHLSPRNSSDLRSLVGRVTQHIRHLRVKRGLTVVTDNDGRESISF